MRLSISHWKRTLPLLKNIQDSTKEQAGLGQRAADKIARFGGSWKFIIVFSIILGAWIVVNTVFAKAKTI